ncbi:MFS transporter [Rhodoligotrophos ferricapiens]|uniref:MFS transporter n=1 Tax=Rhodoligotrophos ferricapiens TaxID=3069264 RepID=UPI00315D108C
MDTPLHTGRSKRASLTLLLISEVAAMSAWFATTASLADLTARAALSHFQQALLTSSVQAGFVAGTLASALLVLADRFDTRRLFSISAFTAALANLAMLAFEPASLAVPFLRFITGMCMAGVYPVGMKLASSWAKGDLGLLIGLLVAALTIGSASPHAIAVFGGVGWQWPIAAAAFGCLAASILILFAKTGPNVAPTQHFQFDVALTALRDRSLRCANLGYFGHMWELYAMWAWIGVFLAASFTERYGSTPPLDARFAAFLVVGVGALGALGGGLLADRMGRTFVTIASMLVSGSCAMLIGFTYGGPAALTLAVALLWGVTIVSDSAQFSAAVAELSNKCFVGTMLTVQTCIGYLITLASIHLMPYVVDAIGWHFAFSVLAVGPFLGAAAMAGLRRSPEAYVMAGGRR